MSSDWKESAIERKDFRRSKTDPQIPKKQRKTKTKKLFKVVVKDHIFDWIMTSSEPKDWVLGKYRNINSAKQALSAYKRQSFYNTFEIVIEEI